MQNKFEAYALLDAQIAELEAKKDAMRNEILADMAQRGVESEKHSLGQFTIAKLKKWSYPAKVLKLEKEKKQEIANLTDEIKTAKAKAESTGEATYEESNSLRFTSVKI